MENSHQAKAYNKRFNAQRAARKALGNPAAAEGVDFTTEKNAAGGWVVVISEGESTEAADALADIQGGVPTEEEVLAQEESGTDDALDADLTGAEPAPVSDSPLAALLAEVTAGLAVGDALARAYELGLTTGQSTTHRKPTRRAKPASKRTGPTKREQAARLLTNANGATTRDILDLTGWPAVSVPALAKASGLTLRKEKVDGRTRYYGVARAG